eukprot:GHVS01030964.1.p1 GENE.GHVS01030964.1~~GHVS01030964.1.p1  ORF type:complete len:734 (-),score=159.02 GHVS01030964.1:600-2519(-)
MTPPAATPLAPRSSFSSETSSDSIPACSPKIREQEETVSYDENEVRRQTADSTFGVILGNGEKKKLQQRCPRVTDCLPVIASLKLFSNKVAIDYSQSKCYCSACCAAQSLCHQSLLKYYVKTPSPKNNNNQQTSHSITHNNNPQTTPSFVPKQTHEQIGGSIRQEQTGEHSVEPAVAGGGLRGGGGIRGGGGSSAVCAAEDGDECKHIVGEVDRCDMKTKKEKSATSSQVAYVGIPYGWCYFPLRYNTTHYEQPTVTAPTTTNNTKNQKPVCIAEPSVTGEVTGDGYGGVGEISESVVTEGWMFSYHGTTVSSLNAICEDGRLRGTDENLIKSRSHHVSNFYNIKNNNRNNVNIESVVVTQPSPVYSPSMRRFYFTSPSPKYAGFVAYATPFQLPGCSDGWWQAMLEVRLRPGSYTARPQTLLKGHYVIDPNVPNNQIAWRSRDRSPGYDVAVRRDRSSDDNYITGLLIRRLKNFNPSTAALSNKISSHSQIRLGGISLCPPPWNETAEQPTEVDTVKTISGGFPSLSSPRTQYGVPSTLLAHELLWWQPWDGSGPVPIGHGRATDPPNRTDKATTTAPCVATPDGKCGCRDCRRTHREASSVLSSSTTRRGWSFDWLLPQTSQSSIAMAPKRYGTTVY